MRVQGGRNQEVAAGLLRGLRAGSSQARATLYDQLAPGIHRFAISCLSGDAEAAEDLVVETLAHAARGIARFDPQKSSLSAWIYGIARHRVQAELRWYRRLKSVPAWAQVSFEDLSELADSHDLGARTAARLDAQRRVAELPGLLSDDETELLTLSAIEELPVREIGRVVGRSEQATQMLLHRARQKARRTSIEGTLLVSGPVPEPGGVYGEYGHSLSGEKDEWADSVGGNVPELSPWGDEIVYSRGMHALQEWPLVLSHIWKAKRDGSNPLNLTGAAGLTQGICYYPRWSPDGSLIAFVRWTERGGILAGPGEAWVVKADGSAACMAAPRAHFPTHGAMWSADGSRLFCQVAPGCTAGAPVELDLWGRSVRVVAWPWGSADWSPDGTRLAYRRTVRAEMEGEPGVWNQLVVAKGDGSRPRVLVEQFLAEAEILAHLPKDPDPEWPYDWRTDLIHWAGPVLPRWSPLGDRIAFVADLPFSPRHGDTWIYDLVTRRLTKVTRNPRGQTGLSWR